MDNAVEAWLLKTGGALDLAVGSEALVQLIESPSVYPVPGAPLHVRFVMLWQEQIVPVLDPHAWLFGSALRSAKYIALVAYQTAPMTPLKYGAVSLAEIPESIRVQDNMAADLQFSLPENVQAACLSVFKAAGQKVLVPDLQRIFDGWGRSQIPPELPQGTESDASMPSNPPDILPI